MMNKIDLINFFLLKAEQYVILRQKDNIFLNNYFVLHNTKNNIYLCIVEL